MTASERSGSDAAPWPDDLLDRPTRELPGDTASLPPPDEAPTFRALGRFQITRIIGKGSTGIVYAAHDPRTDREVALKVLHRGGSRPPLPRLRREASTQARLSHPNVATIFELGIDGDDLFMVMELVPGRPLDQWLEERARRPEAIVEMFIRAGRGLAAIHHAGLVHHDFKPSNVLVGDDGRPRIIDFGLTRPHTELGSTGDSSPPNPEARAASIEAHPRVTRPRMSWGGGTLVFMAPEQHLALPVTASSDQFAFAVALHEALLGVHPFVSDGRWQRLPQRVLQGELADLPAGLDGFRTQVAQRLRRAMAVEPKDRWPSMDALADELQQTRTRPRWKGWRTRSLMLGALAVGVVVWRSSPTVEPCTDVARQLDAVWSSERRESVREGLAQTGTAYALTTRQRVTAMVDRWSERWIQARHHACTEALAGRLSATAHAERTRCLDAHREALDARLTLFEVADSDVVQHAFGSISTLPPIDVCLDPAPATRDQLDSTEEPAADTVQATLGVVRALESTGRYAAALEQAELALDHAMEEGTPRAQAEARLLVGRLQRLLGKPGSAANLRQTFFDATALSLDEVAADAALDMISLASTTATEAQDIEAETWVRRAEALLQHRHDEPRAAQWLHNRGALAAHQERHEQAYALYRAALEAERRVWGDEHFVVARTLNNLGANSDQRGDPSASVRYYQQALDIYDRTVSRYHPSVGNTLFNLGLAYRRLKRWDEATASIMQALEVFERAHGSEHASVARALNSASNLYARVQQWDKAVDALRRALTIFERTLGPNHPRLAHVLGNLGLLEMYRGRYDQGRIAFERALSVVAAQDTVDRAKRALFTMRLGRAYFGMGDRAAARAALRRAQAEGDAVSPALHAEILSWLDRVDASARGDTHDDSG